jgi:23S rRNA pseudouridine2605 synthase
VRLNKFLAKQLGISRREADTLILAEKVMINKTKAVLGTQLEEGQTVEIYKTGSWKTFDNNLENQETILFYKPIFCVTVDFDAQKRKTVYDFLPEGFKGLKTATRLDYMSEGLVVLSSNKELLKKLSDSKHEDQKTYFIALKKALLEEQLEILKDGFKLDEKVLKPITASLLSDEEKINYKYLKLQPNFVWYKFSLLEGRNNLLRKICQVFDQNAQRIVKIKQDKYEITENLYNQKFIGV